MDDRFELPPNLPMPVDDGACDHLLGRLVPDVELMSTDGHPTRLRYDTERRCVLYVYPRTGTPGRALPDGWDLIPGARGCTPQSCGFRDHWQELRDLGTDVRGISSQSPEEQLEFARRVGMPFQLLSDPDLVLAEELSLPTFEVEGQRLYRRCTLVAEGSVIVKVFYPVFPPDRNAEEVVRWLSARRRRFEAHEVTSPRGDIRIERATHDDYLEILRDLPDFWATSEPASRTLPCHAPFLVHEFGDTAFVVRADGIVVGYLFGFIANAEPVGYIHLVGVRASHQRTGIGRALYQHFARVARGRGCRSLRAVTAPFNTDSQAFHATLGFEATGPSRDANGLPVYPDYHGPGEDVIIFSKRIVT